jgi:hypothetical protein
MNDLPVEFYSYVILERHLVEKYSTYTAKLRLKIRLSVIIDLGVHRSKQKHYVLLFSFLIQLNLLLHLVYHEQHLELNP